MESHPVICDWVGVSKILLLVESFWDFAAYSLWSFKWNSSYFGNRHFKVEHKLTGQFNRVHIWPKKALVKWQNNKFLQIQGLGLF